jgi:PAS domain S-box-containing protein
MLNNEIYRSLVDQAPDAILYSDREGLIRLWNAGAERIFGYSAAEALGQSLDLIIPDKLRGRHWEGYFRVMESGETKYGTEMLAVPASHKDGSRLSVEFSIVMPLDENGTPLGVGAIMRDVSHHRAELQKLRERIAELESRSS